jgi:hypothetical protein
VSAPEATSADTGRPVNAAAVQVLPSSSEWNRPCAAAPNSRLREMASWVSGDPAGSPAAGGAARHCRPSVDVNSPAEVAARIVPLGSSTSAKASIGAPAGVGAPIARAPATPPGEPIMTGVQRAPREGDQNRPWSVAMT